MINDDELKDGFLVTQERKKLFEALLDILERFMAVCDKHGLKYWAIFGTLLGAVRHKGFIPWDDDIDIAMPRDDYEKLLKLNAFSEPYFLQTTTNEEGYYKYAARLRNSNTTIISIWEKRFLEKKIKPLHNMGIFISIFPLDGVPKSRLNTFFQNKAASLRNRLIRSYLYHKLRKPTVINTVAYAYCNLAGYKKIFNRLHKSYAKYGWDESERIHIAPPLYNDDLCWYREDFEQTIYLQFEHLQIPAPKGFDRVLTIEYGAYMDFPPMNERGLGGHGDILQVPYTEYTENLI